MGSRGTLVRSSLVRCDGTLCTSRVSTLSRGGWCRCVGCNGDGGGHSPRGVSQGSKLWWRGLSWFGVVMMLNLRIIRDQDCIYCTRLVTKSSGGRSTLSSRGMRRNR